MKFFPWNRWRNTKKDSWRPFHQKKQEKKAVTHSTCRIFKRLSSTLFSEKNWPWLNSRLASAAAWVIAAYFRVIVGLRFHGLTHRWLTEVLTDSPWCNFVSQNSSYLSHLFWVTARPADYFDLHSFYLILFLRVLVSLFMFCKEE